MTTRPARPASSVITLGMPLLNPENLFSHKAWASVFSFYCDRTKGSFLGPDSLLSVKITDLYLRKTRAGFNFENAAKEIATFSQVESSTNERNDRNDEPVLSFKFGSKPAYLQDYRESVAFSFNGSTTFNHTTKTPKFKMKMADFLKTIATLERVLSHPGAPVLCRGNLEVEFGRAKITAFCHFETIELDSQITGRGKLPKLHRIGKPPKFQLILR
jgi:hypothetical protein